MKMNNVQHYFEFVDTRTDETSFSVKAYNLNEAKLTIEIAMNKLPEDIDWNYYKVKMYDVDWHNSK